MIPAHKEENHLHHGITHAAREEHRKMAHRGLCCERIRSRVLSATNGAAAGALNLHVGAGKVRSKFFETGKWIRVFISVDAQVACWGWEGGVKVQDCSSRNGQHGGVTEEVQA